MLGSFGFSGDAADRRIAELSGGERTRLALAKTMVVPVNLLVLDEPTNHLDLPSSDILEDALQAYPGTVLLVTHDRHLIRGVCDALIEVRGGRAIWHEGVPDDVLKPLGTIAVDGPAGGSGRSSGSSKSQARREKKRAEAETRNASHAATKELRRTLQSVERAWAKAEAEVADLQGRLADPESYDDPDALTELIAAHDEAKDRAEKLMADWEAATLALEAAGG